MIKEVVIIILFLLVVGLYFSPEITKSLMKTTGSAVLNISKEGANKIKETETVKNITERVREDFNSTMEGRK